MSEYVQSHNVKRTVQSKHIKTVVRKIKFNLFFYLVHHFTPILFVGVIVAAAFCGFVMNKTFVTWFLGQLVFIRDLPQPDFISNFGIGNFQANPV